MLASILCLTLGIQFSCMSGGEVMYEPPNSIERNFFDDVLFLQFDADLEIKHLIFVRGKMRTAMFMEQEKIFMFPVELSSYFETGLKFSILEVGWTHLCIHPVVPNYFVKQNREYKDQTFNEIFIRGKVKFGK